ncbi:histidine phosphatase family protein [Planotetraspora sp. GP83]|uniref:SixA phosphatase family protein n=1 Tax=Planotetraspora sp. GP83 TaxID=3156264 RepID=UPI0035181359
MSGLTVIVLRHAKAAHDGGLADWDRPLTARGERNAREAGDLIGRFAPGLILASPSVRTRQTAELLGLDAPIEFERDIYEAYPEELLDLLRRTDSDVETVVLVGHNPGVHQLVLTLTGTAGDHFPPGAFAVIELPGPWPEAAPGEGRLVSTHFP